MDDNYSSFLTTRPESRCNRGRHPPRGIFPSSILLLSLLHRIQKHKVPGHSSLPPLTEQRTKFTFPFLMLFMVEVTKQAENNNSSLCCTLLSFCIEHSIILSCMSDYGAKILSTWRFIQTAHRAQIMSTKKSIDINYNNLALATVI